MSALGAAAHAKVHVVYYRADFSGEASFRTSGIVGRLFGHFSRGDQLDIEMRTEASFRKLHPNSRHWLVLPSVMDRFSEKHLEDIEIEAMFGSRPHRGKRMFYEGRVVIPFLTSGEDHRGFEVSLEVTAPKLVLRTEDEELASIAIDDSSRLMREMSFKRDDSHEPQIALSSALRNAFGDQLRKLPKIAERDIALNLEFDVDGRTVDVPLHEWEEVDHDEFKNLFFVSWTRFTRPVYLKHFCDQTLAR